MSKLVRVPDCLLQPSPEDYIKEKYSEKKCWEHWKWLAPKMGEKQQSRDGGSPVFAWESFSSCELFPLRTLFWPENSHPTQCRQTEKHCSFPSAIESLFLQENTGAQPVLEVLKDRWSTGPFWLWPHLLYTRTDLEKRGRATGRAFTFKQHHPESSPYIPTSTPWNQMPTNKWQSHPHSPR